jgi:hypothetical protein
MDVDSQSRGPADTSSRFTTLVGKLSGFAEAGIPLVSFIGNPDCQPLPARHACAITSGDVGREAVLVFDDGDPRKPIILGLLHAAGQVPATADEPEPLTASVGDEQITLTARNEIVLRCGKASITLTKAGKVLIRGAYLLSRSSGVNRIKGGSVQIN